MPIPNAPPSIPNDSTTIIIQSPLTSSTTATSVSCTGHWHWAVSMGHWALGIGHSAVSIWHGALGIGVGNWAWGIVHGALGIDHWAAANANAQCQSPMLHHQSPMIQSSSSSSNLHYPVPNPFLIIIRTPDINIITVIINISIRHRACALGNGHVALGIGDWAFGQ